MVTFGFRKARHFRRLRRRGKFASSAFRSLGSLGVFFSVAFGSAIFGSFDRRGEFLSRERILFLFFAIRGFSLRESSLGTECSRMLPERLRAAPGFRKSVVSHAKPTHRAVGLQKSFFSSPNGRRGHRSRRGRRRAESAERDPRRRLEILSHRAVARRVCPRDLLRLRIMCAFSRLDSSLGYPDSLSSNQPPNELRGRFARGGRVPQRRPSIFT